MKIDLRSAYGRAFSYRVDVDTSQLQRTYAHVDLRTPGPSLRRHLWVRGCAVLGNAPGSNGMGTKVHVWRSWAGEDGRDGWNLRFFHSFTRPCLTLLIHWQRR